jgi:hypothetical protein
MVTYGEIIKAINVKIISQFSNITFQSMDEQEGLIRPSFRTNLDDIKVSNFMDVAKDREITVRIYYFPKDKNKYRIELLSMQDTLENLFLVDNTIITDSGFVLEIYECEFDVVDGVLHFYFELMISEDFNRVDTGDNMEDLDYKQELN